ncbi:MAG: hypothetical protein K0Q76_3590 [Panacagrimonas sp.]|jgi:hypothetical protein|nr:DUF6036 family nucleotidyltransferase [Panacagrimonas sp.]MCC2658482.1 hypothetical protein [Panacagrimonas sp.]
MKLEELFTLADEARRLTGHAELVVIGSNSILCLANHAAIPDTMTMSIDVDAYLKSDPGRTGLLKADLGEGSHFHRQHGIFLDPVSPRLATLPEGWTARLLSECRGTVTLWFLDPDDAAISKYARLEARDRRWIREGLAAGLLSMPKIKARLGKTTFLDKAEETRARAAIEEDGAWLARAV